MFRSRLGWSWLPALALMASALGVFAFRDPQLTLVGVAVLIVLGIGVAATGSLPRLFLASLGGILLGYAFLGRPFAYFRVGPVYIGEVVLGLGLLVAVALPRRWTGSFSPLALGITGYVLWGASRTIPYIGTYGQDALRDGAAWAYALFAVLVCRFVTMNWMSGRIPRWYARLFPWLLIWAPLALLLDNHGVRSPLFSVKAGDLAVHLAGASAFLLSGLYANVVAKSHLHVPERLLYLVWLLGCVFVLFYNRGGTLAILASVIVVLVLRPKRVLGKVAWIAAVILAATLTSLAFNVKGTIRGRNASAREIATIFSSIKGQSSYTPTSSTREWRLNWWDKIWAYTVHGPYFWTGKGYGINLANDDGFQVLQGELLRSPHNGAFTVLARSGVPGFAVWLFVQLAFAIGMVRAYLRALRAGSESAAQLHLWILAYWVAALVNSCFDVYLEGPQGAIWFWSIVGLGRAAQRGLEVRATILAVVIPRRALATNQPGLEASG
jgi:O-antigen ligase